MERPELEFFNSLSGTLEIELNNPANPVAGLLNLSADSDAKITAVRLAPEVFVDSTNDFRPLSEAELASTAYLVSSIRLRGEFRDTTVDHEATERMTREKTKWLGGVDVHHIFFEGLHPDEDGNWVIQWGS
ncbi:hypothetical protein Pla123a_03560 [Posidoniimonas polymericola]|uniref:Uncharacterized protein n=1 Tax=Posidoniimonas polymericola TaxID=2528002 RepID=A0A5C5ZDQ1_9BACT|nr:hypothetical protein [Posidoniimonas polymericola]TWT85549.1 hypothetical protein Pla123a_03560 [Posidoniimonas polymericola]